MALDGADGVDAGGGGADTSAPDAGNTQGPDPSSPGNTTGDDGDRGGRGGSSPTDDATTGAAAQDAMSSPAGSDVVQATADQVGGDDEDDDTDDAPDAGPASGGDTPGGTGTGMGGAPDAVADALAEDPVEAAAREQAEALDAEHAERDRAQAAREAQDRAQTQMTQSQAALAQGDAVRAEQERARDAQAAQDLADQLAQGGPAAPELSFGPEVPADLHMAHAGAHAGALPAGAPIEVPPGAGLSVPSPAEAARALARRTPAGLVATTAGAWAVDELGERHQQNEATRDAVAERLGLDRATAPGTQAAGAHVHKAEHVVLDAAREAMTGGLSPAELAEVDAQAVAALELAEPGVTTRGRPGRYQTAGEALAEAVGAVREGLDAGRVGAPPAGGGWAPGVAETVGALADDGRAPHEWDGITEAQRTAFAAAAGAGSVVEGPVVEGLPDQSDVVRDLGRLPGFGEGAPVIDGGEVEGLDDQRGEVEALTGPGVTTPPDLPDTGVEGFDVLPEELRGPDVLEARTQAELNDAIANLPHGERRAAIIEAQRQYATEHGWTRARALERLNQGQGYDIFVDDDGQIRSGDQLHGHWELHDRRGRHQGATGLDGETLPGRAGQRDPSGQHDIRVR